MLRAVLEDVETSGVDKALLDIERIILKPQSASPPFAPPRFKLPADRTAVSKSLVIHGKDSTKRYDITLGYYPDGKLGEVFVRQEREGGTVGSLLDATATVISIALQYGVPWPVFAEKLAHQRFEPAGMTEDSDNELKMVSSLLDYFARWVSKRVRLATESDGDDD